MADGRYVLRAEGVRKAFGANEALKSAALWAEPGMITTLLGRNGSGKTTLMKIAAGLMPADQGVVSFMGDADERHTLARLARRGLMYLPQEPLGVPAYRVSDLFGAVERTFRTGRADAAIATTRLEALQDQRVASLSRGERVRVSIGLALARPPTGLLADEPLVGLAPTDQQSIAASLRALAAEGVAIVTSGHDVRALMGCSDIIIWSTAGTTHHLGSPADAVVNWQFRREYLGPSFELGAPDPQGNA